MQRILSLEEAQSERSESVDRSIVVRRQASRRRGQSLVELALALPLLILLMVGTIDLGRAFFDYVQMRNGAFEGARYGSLSPTDTTGITNAVKKHGVPSDTVVKVKCSIDCSAITVDSNATITVTASRTFTPLTTSFLQKFFGIGPFKLNASATMKVMS